MPTTEQNEWDHKKLGQLVDLIMPACFTGPNFNPVFVCPYKDHYWQVIFPTYHWEGKPDVWATVYFDGMELKELAFRFAHGLPGPKTVYNLTIEKDPVLEGRS